MLDNYPPGAANDPNAPYNQPEPELITVPVTVFVTYEVDTEVEVYEDYCQEDLDKAAKKQLYFPHEVCNASDKSKYCPNWEIESWNIWE